MTIDLYRLTKAIINGVDVPLDRATFDSSECLTVRADGTLGYGITPAEERRYIGHAVDSAIGQATEDAKAQDSTFLINLNTGIYQKEQKRMKYKVGDKVNAKTICDGLISDHGKIGMATITRICELDSLYPYFLHFEGKGSAWCSERDFEPFTETASSKLTKAQKQIKDLESQIAAIKAAEEQKAKKRAEREAAKAKKEAAAKLVKQIRGLPLPAKRAVKLLRADRSAFGGQRSAVIALTAAIVGVDDKRLVEVINAVVE